MDMIIRDPVTEDMTVLQIVDNNCPLGWEWAFKDAYNSLKDISSILANLEKKRKWYPLKVDLFRAFTIIRPEDVKVCIIGMDPYHSTCKNGLPTAMGLSFSSRRGEPIPPSLRNVFLELARSIPSFRTPNHGDLSRWCYQGVLLMNACLTVNPGEAGSHKDVWRALTNSVLSLVANRSPHCIYLLWGKNAQRLSNNISGKATILESLHPSPFNSNRNDGFVGCGHFVEVNRLLKERGETEIDWNLD